MTVAGLAIARAESVPDANCIASRRGRAQVRVRAVGRPTGRRQQRQLAEPGGQPSRASWCREVCGGEIDEAVDANRRWRCAPDGRRRSCAAQYCASTSLRVSLDASAGVTCRPAPGIDRASLKLSTLCAPSPSLRSPVALFPPAARHHRSPPILRACASWPPLALAHHPPPADITTFAHLRQTRCHPARRRS